MGIHTGKTVNMTIKPAPVNHGFAFSRIDLEGSPIIEAKVEYVVNTQRGTNLEKNGVQIQTSEHVLAAAVGLNIDNLLIELDSPEPPIMDGSSKYFVEALEKAGIEDQDAEIEEYVVNNVCSQARAGGTCRIGKVVDNCLARAGIEKLRIIDASVM